MKTDLGFVLIALVMLSVGCTKESLNTNAIAANNSSENIASVHFVGEHYGGGVVFAIDATGAHGIIADLTDLGLYTWRPGNIITITGANKEGYGAGKSNTIAIIKSHSAIDPDSSYAAFACGSLIKEGFSDWYLPSRKELRTMYSKRRYIGNFSTDYPYWSSTETTGNSADYAAWGFSFLYGTEDTFTKYTVLRVRAVRYF